ncbi:MAG: ATP-dependent DNA helicase RecG, partial [Hyphomicrobiales bacterium]|nr:ATP-dependent DNA helicase RecG [Hyphomicrobiales bacterium]
MRPPVLDPLFAPVSALRGVGPAFAKAYDRLLGQDGRPARVVDVLFHAPVSTVDRRSRTVIARAKIDEVATFKARVVEHRPPKFAQGRRPFRVLVEDETGDAELVWFAANASWIEKTLPIGAERWISGKLELFDGRRQIVHPDRVMDEAGLARLPPVEPVYGLTEGLAPRVAQAAARAALERLPALPEWHDADALRLARTPGFADALKALHA